MLVGSIGKEIIFWVSEHYVLTFRDASVKRAGRWATHDVIGDKPRSEFLGQDLDTVKMTIHLDANYGVLPQAAMRAIKRLVDTGEAHYFIAGGLPVCDNPVSIISMSEAWNIVKKHGIIVNADVNIELKEYV